MMLLPGITGSSSLVVITEPSGERGAGWGNGDTEISPLPDSSIALLGQVHIHPAALKVRDVLAATPVHAI